MQKTSNKTSKTSKSSTFKEETSLKINGKKTSKLSSSTEYSNTSANRSDSFSSYKSQSKTSDDKSVKSTKKLIPLREQTLPKRSLTDFRKKELKEKLFSSILNSTSKDELVRIESQEPSILITGFGMRNLKSFQNELMLDEKQRIQQLYSHQKKNIIDEQDEYQSSYTSTSKSSILDEKFTESSQTDSTTPKTDFTSQEKLAYLLGIPSDGEEHKPTAIETKLKKEESEEKFITGTTESMRRAQTYLRTHKIFEFFQYLIAFLLSIAPDNPIDCILELLDKCLLYRSGMGKAPLLYEKRHIEQLFNLMDRMGTGFIELDQYKTGMATLGICCYNESVSLSPNGMVSKEVFIDDAYKCLVNILNDLLRKRDDAGSIEPSFRNPSNATVDTYSTITGNQPHFIPPELLLRSKHKKDDNFKTYKTVPLFLEDRYDG